MLIGTCVQLCGDAINQMCDNATETTYTRAIELAPDIMEWFGGATPHIKDDYAVSFNISRYAGIMVVYVTHSAIEHVFKPSTPTHR